MLTKCLHLTIVTENNQFVVYQETAFVQSTGVQNLYVRDNHDQYGHSKRTTYLHNSNLHSCIHLLNFLTDHTLFKTQSIIQKFYYQFLDLRRHPYVPTFMNQDGK